MSSEVSAVMYDALDTILCFGSEVIRWLVDDFNAVLNPSVFRCPSLLFQASLTLRLTIRYSRASLETLDLTYLTFCGQDRNRGNLSAVEHNIDVPSLELLPYFEPWMPLFVPG